MSIDHSTGRTTDSPGGQPVPNPFEPPRAAVTHEADPHAAIHASASSASSLFLRGVGAVLGAFGVLLTGLIAWPLLRRIGRGSWPISHFRIEPKDALFSSITLALGLFCLLAGYRLLFLRPTARGSLLGPVGWYTLAAAIGAVCLLLAVQTPLPETLVPLGFGLLFCGGCILAARRQTHGRAFGEPAPDEAIAPRRLVPEAHAQAWLELANDDKTPMEFVVHTLCTLAGLSRDEALVLMLRVHREGSARLPLGSLEDAQDLAARIAERAGKAGHPLACVAIAKADGVSA